jgi:hypothetical protein
MLSYNAGLQYKNRINDDASLFASQSHAGSEFPQLLGIITAIKHLLANKMQ